MATCKAIKKDGRRCSKKTKNGEDYCWVHKPKSTQQHAFLLRSLIERLQNHPITIIISLLGTIAALFGIVSVFADWGPSTQQLRKWSRAAGICIPLEFTAASENETLILIATFSDPHDDKPHREIHDNIQEEAQKLNESALRVGIEPTVLESNQRAEAEALGKCYNASMVIWGDITRARVTVNFLNLRQPKFNAAATKISETERTELANPSAYASFITQDLPRTMSFFAFFAVGQSYYLNTQYPLAIEWIDAAVTLVPPDTEPEGLAEAYFRLGWLYQFPTPNNLNQSIADYDRAIQLNPDYALAYYNRASTRYDQGKLDEAIVDCHRAIQLNPELANAFTLRGLTYRKLGEPEKALADFRRYLELRPGSDSRAQVTQLINETEAELAKPK